MVRPRSRFPLSRIVLVLLVAGVAAGALACGETAAAPTPTPEPIGIEFDKRSVTVGGVTEGRDVTQMFLLINRGMQAAIVKDVSVLDASECDEVVVPDTPIVVPPGGVSALHVVMKGHRPAASPHTVLLGVQTAEGGDTRSELAITVQGVAAAPGVQSGPRLGIDHRSVDIGDIPYDWPMHERFVLFNHGDQTLQLESAPLVRILEGCWQPIPVVGSTTLEPGESTVLDIPLHMGMHPGMGGQHEFAIDIKSNDPVSPVKTVSWKFLITE